MLAFLTERVISSVSDIGRNRTQQTPYTIGTYFYIFGGGTDIRAGGKLKNLTIFIVTEVLLNCCTYFITIFN